MNGSQASEYVRQKLGGPDQRGLPLSGLSAEARNFIIANLDPYHDSQLDSVRIPDNSARPSAGIVLNSSISFSAPAAAVGPWSFAINVNPLLYSQKSIVGNRTAMLFSNGATQDLQTWSSTAFASDFISDHADIRATTTTSYNLSNGPVTVVRSIESAGTFFPNGKVTSMDMNSKLYPVMTDQMVLMPDDNLPTGGAFPQDWLATKLKAYGTNMRLVAMGLEVINTTPELYKSGTLTICEIPRSENTECGDLWIVGPGAGGDNRNPAATRVPYTVLQAGAATISEALAQPRSVQIDAKGGCYVPIGIDHSQNSFRHPTTQFIVQSNDDTIQKVSPGVGGVLSTDIGTLIYTPAGSFNQSSGAAVPYYPSANQILPINTYTVIGSGLDKASSFTVKVRLYLELAPKINDDTYGAYAYMLTPSPPFEPSAFVVLENIRRQIPVAVPYSMNPSGEFWDLVRGVASRVLPVLGGAARMILPGALGSIAGMASDGLASALAPPSAMGKRSRATSASSSVRSSRAGSTRGSRRGSVVKVRVRTSSSKKKKRG